MIRQAGKADAARVLELVRAYYVYDSIDFDESLVGPALERLLEDPSLGFVLVADVGGRTTAYLTATWGYDVEFGGRFALLTDFFVEKENRGAGYGRAMLAAAEQKAREGGAVVLEGQVMRGNERARGFYREWGFQFPDRMVMTRRL